MPEYLSEPDRAFGPVLVGMRGAGKSTVGARLAEMLGGNGEAMAFVDADAEIATRCGQPIATMFAARGEEFFRARERETLLDVLQLPHRVVATGGGAVLHADVRAVLKSRVTVWLRADVATLAARVAGSDRPSLTGAPIADELAGILAARAPLYAEVAALIVDVESQSPLAVATRVAEWWRERVGGREPE